MLEELEQQTNLTKNQWLIAGAATIGDMLDFFDFGLIAFVLAFIVKDWRLTFGEAGLILLASGISAPFGSLLWGWAADKIGRRKAMIGTVLNTSIATGAMALTPEHAWIYLVFCRLFVGFGVTGMYSVDITVIQEFVPTAKRGWLTGLTTTMLPAGFLLGALLSAFATPYIGWRGLFAVGLLPAFLTLYIRAWVPESPYWLMRMGRFEEARQSLAWALQIDPKDIALPTVRPMVEYTRWTELFKYPRSIFAGALTGLSQTGGVALALWQVILLVMVLKITPPQRHSPIPKTPSPRSRPLMRPTGRCRPNCSPARRNCAGFARRAPDWAARISTMRWSTAMSSSPACTAAITNISPLTRWRFCSLSPGASSTTCRKSGGREVQG